uniref:E2 ubiquitin-conjugating enzyme n=1 Tax=Macrostomum lignano TaxID=282301 RepID=A0A1I8FYD5_9PLAT
MSNIADQRIRREFKEVMKSNEIASHHIRVEPVSDNLRKLRGEICGPPDTPYEHGKFQLEVVIPDTYPFTPPKVKFITRIWHPNISSVTGAICLDILKDQWAAAMTLRTVLLSLQALLASPEPDDPQTRWLPSSTGSSMPCSCRRPGTGPTPMLAPRTGSPTFKAKVESLKQMGFPEHDCRVALSSNVWNLERATEHLLNQ